MNYNVGDIVWVVLSKRPGLVVLQISEQIIKKTLAGEEIIYHLKPMNAREKNDAVITLDQIPGEIYKSSTAARNAMIEAATNAIDNMIEDAQQLLTEKLGKKQEEKSESKNPTFRTITDSIELPDGTKARINLPPELKEIM